MEYFAPPKTKVVRHHRATYGSSGHTAPIASYLQWEPYYDDKVRERTNGHVVTFANREQRDRWLVAQHPTLHSKRKAQNTAIAVREGKGMA